MSEIKRRWWSIIMVYNNVWFRCHAPAVLSIKQLWGEEVDEEGEVTGIRQGVRVSVFACACGRPLRSPVCV